MKKIYSYLHGTVSSNKHIIRFLFILFILGLTSGSLFINYINDKDLVTLTNNISNYFSNIKDMNEYVFGLSIFKEYVINNIFLTIIIFILGISIIGVLVVIIFIFFKGFTLGLTLSSFIVKYKLKGILSIILYVFPFNLIEILIYMFLSLYAVNSCLKLIRGVAKKDNINFKTFIGKYTLSFIISLILLTLNSLLKAYIFPFILKIFTIII